MIEEKEFVLRFTVTAQFGDDEDPEDDDYAWAAKWDEQVRSAVLQSVFAALKGQKAFDFRVLNRGKSPDEEVELLLELRR